MGTKQRNGFTQMASVWLLGLPGMALGVPPDPTQGGKPDNEHRWTLGDPGASGVAGANLIQIGNLRTPSSSAKYKPCHGDLLRTVIPRDSSSSTPPRAPTPFLPLSEPHFSPSCAPTRKSNFLAI